MLKQEIINKIADTLKVKAETLAEAIKSQDEVAIELPNVTSYSENELTSLKDNVKKDGYSDGKKAGSEMTAKKLKEISGVETEGKDLDKIFKDVKTKIEKDAKIEPNEKVSSLESKIEKLQQTVQTQETLISDWQTKHNGYKSKIELLSMMPDNTIGLSKEVVFKEMQSSGYEVVEKDGKRFVLKNGVELNDNVENPIPFQTVATNFLTEKNWLKVEGRTGRGGGDERGSDSQGTPKNYEEFVKQCEADGINPAGAEAQAKATIYAKENSEFYN